jgi:hypothetical protein
MTLRIVPDDKLPSAAIEIPLEKPLPDYDLDQMEQPTPRDVDGILVSQGFRDLIDDARGVLIELLCQEKPALELSQLTGAICPGADEVYRPGLWIVVRDPNAAPNAPLPQAAKERVAGIAKEFAKRLELDEQD